MTGQLPSTLGWAVVGLGNIVRSTIAPGIVKDSAASLVAAVSRDQGRADAFAAEFGAKRGYDDLDAALADPDVDAVFIATPNAVHAEQVAAVAAAGKHVLCEKPIATSVADAVREVRQCADAGVRFGVNFHNRYLQWVRDAKQLIADGAIGTVQTVEVEVSAGNKAPKDWRRSAALAGLGTTYNIGVHAFDFLRYLLDDDPAEVFALFDVPGGSLETETEALLLMRNVSGTHVYANVNQKNPHPLNRIAIYGTEGRITGTGLTRSRSDGELRVLTADGEDTRFYEQPSGWAHEQCVAGFTRAVLDDRDPDPAGIDGLHSAILCEGIARSVAERRLVELDYSQVPAVP